MKEERRRRRRRRQREDVAEVKHWRRDGPFGCCGCCRLCFAGADQSREWGWWGAVTE